jgi:uncharacterized Rmd1/YagE family protein
MTSKAKKAGKHSKYTAETVYLGEYIDLKRVQESIKKYVYMNRDEPLVLRLLKDQYAVLTKFGAVTFWNVPAKLRHEFINELQPFVKSKRDFYPYDEDTKVIVGEEHDKVTFDIVYLTSLNAEKIKIISYVLSQSVALERYEGDIENILMEIGVIVENLKNTGKPLLKQNEVLKQIGRVLSVKQTAVAHLSLFDKPEDIWYSPELEMIYNRMHSEYDVRTRFDVLNHKIDYLSDTSETLMNYLTTKEDAYLEKIIIYLILLEIVLLFLPEPYRLTQYIISLFR